MSSLTMVSFLRLISLVAVMSPTVVGQVARDRPPVSQQPVALNHAVSLDEPALDSATGVETASLDTADPAAPVRNEEDLASSVTVVRRTAPRRTLNEAMQRTEAVATPWYRGGLGALAIVLGLVGAAAWAVRRWVPAARIAGSAGLRVVGRTSITPKHSVALVRVGRRFVLVGVSPERMTALCEVNDPDEVAELAVHAGIAGDRSDEAFDKVLLNEATVYAEGGSVEVATPRPDPRGSGRPLNDLLNRLKTLQRP